ncbi:MAG TPA: AAA family ATPase [Pseudonocardia sp.]|nr:AAA family ATPase [Pseudonocardia sp.]
MPNLQRDATNGENVRMERPPERAPDDRATPGHPFVERRPECTELEAFAWSLRAGQSRALVLVGEPGVGKTALLSYLVERASGCRVLRGRGIEAERELGFAGLHQVCTGLLDRGDQLPDPQRTALHTALGLAAGPAPDRFRVGLAVLGLFAEAATELPLLCLIDDAQWLDRESAQVFAFAARRMASESVGLVLAVRTLEEARELAGLAQLAVHGLAEAEARALLDSVLPGQVDERVLDRIVAESRGNPLALLELPRALMAPELPGGFQLASASASLRGVEARFGPELAALPCETRRLLLVAAAEPMGDPVLMWRAANQIGIDDRASAPADAAGLLTIDSRVRFRHPLLRLILYRAAPAEERRLVHGALAAATDPDTDPEQRAWHTAQAEDRPEEAVAAELERSADRSRVRGRHAAAATFLARAAELTPDPAHRALRRLKAAQITHQAGALDVTQQLLALAEAGPLAPLPRAQAALLRGRVALVARRCEASPLLRTAAVQLESLEPRLARDAYLEAIASGWDGGAATKPVNLPALVSAARAVPLAHADPTDRLLEGLATLLTAGYPAAVPIVRHALQALCAPTPPGEESVYWLQLAATAAAHIWDDQTWRVLAAHHAQLARGMGAFSMLAHALSMSIAAHTCTGDLAGAAALAEERAVLTKATGHSVPCFGTPVLTAWQGRDGVAEIILDTLDAESHRHGEDHGTHTVAWAKALLYNSLGRYDDALAVAQPASLRPAEAGVPLWGAQVELVEAASRAGVPDRATRAVEQLGASARAAGTEWALGIAARCRALVGDCRGTEAAFRESVQRLGRTRMQSELARSHLLYGEWLRRQQRRADARQHLHVAHEMFVAMGAEAFAQRTNRELGAAGETVRKGKVETTGRLTAQEVQVAALVREGLSNPEIGARLFISPRTVEWHLGNIFSKLSITSRRQLCRRSPFLTSTSTGTSAGPRKEGNHRGKAS